MGNNNTPKLGCGTILIIILIILFLIGSSGSNSSSRSTTYTPRTSNPIRDKDPEFYDYLENRYNNMIKNQSNP